MAVPVTLRDGTPALIWPLLPTDARGLQENYARLSADSRYSRFLTGTPALTDKLLRVLIDDVDEVDHIARVLMTFPSQGPEQAAGVGRILRYHDSSRTADVAVTVADRWQGRGVATALLAELVGQRPDGVDELLTQVAIDNTASLAMLARLGAASTSLAGPGVVDVRVPLPPVLSHVGGLGASSRRLADSLPHGYR